MRIFLVLIFSVFGVMPGSWGSGINGKIISGIYSQILPLPLLYDSYVPVILEFKTPKWSKTEVTFNNWYNCTGERYPYALSCPMTFNLNNAIQNLHTDFESLQPGKDEEGHLNSDYYDQLTSQAEFCDVIQKHFASIYTHTVDFENYLEILRKCATSKFDPSLANSSTTHLFHIERNISEYIYSIRSPYSRMESNFYESFYRPVSTGAVNETLVKLLASAALSNSRSALQGSLLGHFYAERNRWTHAIANCQMNRLPSSLVNETKLRNILTKINSSQTSQLAIPLEFISKFFSLPLTDCTHTHNALVIRLLVPVLKNPNSFTLRSVRVVPFLVNNKICQLKNIRDGATFLFDPVNFAAYDTDCGSSEPCDISASRLSTRINLCASMIFSHKVDAMIDLCQFECQEYLRPPFPRLLVQQIATNKFVLTGQTALQLICKLNAAETTTIDIDLSGIDHGAFELVLNCDCQLSIKTGTHVPSTFQSNLLVSCDQVRPFYQIFQTVPWHFVRSEKKKEIHDEIVYKFHSNNLTIEDEPMDVEIFNENVQHLLDSDFMDLVTSGSVGKFPQPQVRDEERPKGSENEVTESKFNWLFIPLLILVGVLCVGQIFLFYQMRQFRGSAYFSFNNSVLYKSTTTPSLIMHEND